MVAENNSVRIVGTVVEPCVFSHQVYGEGFYMFYILAERLSDAADVLPVTVSERLLDVESLAVGTAVHIQGQLRSYNQYTGERSRLVLTIFAREITVCQVTEGKKPNEICLNGFLCKPPNYRTTPFGREITDLLLAVNRAYHKSDYIPCIAWGRNARFAGSLSVGQQIRIWGRIQSRRYVKRRGEEVEERVAYEVSISKIELVSEDAEQAEADGENKY